MDFADAIDTLVSEKTEMERLIQIFKTLEKSQPGSRKHQIQTGSYRGTMMSSKIANIEESPKRSEPSRVSIQVRTDSTTSKAHDGSEASPLKRITERDGFKIGDRVRVHIQRRTGRVLTGTVIAFSRVPGVVIVQRDGCKYKDRYTAWSLEHLTEAAI